MIRDETVLADDNVLVRMLFDHTPGQPAFDRAELIADAGFNYTEFGYYGLSLWAISTAWPLERVLREKVRVARYVALFTAGDLRATGLGLVPSGRHPHYDATLGRVRGYTFGSVSVTAVNAADLVDRFIRSTYTVVENLYLSRQ